MSAPEHSSIILTAIPGATLRFTTDPDGVSTAWDARKILTPGLEGAVTTEDQGMFAVDCTRTLTWGNQWLDKGVILQLREWQAIPGSQYRYEDDEGNDWTVEIVPPIKADRVWRQERLYTCTLTLHVLTMTLWLGMPYTGR